MDVTKSLADAVNALGPQEKIIVTTLMDRMDALEAKSAADMASMADKVIAALVPQAQAMTQTVNAVADQATTALREFLALVKRIDGAKIVLGPEL
jgi:hypothetical protein